MFDGVRVVVKRIGEQEQKSAGGIIIPGTAKEKPQEGKVVAVGPGKNEDRKVLTLEAFTMARNPAARPTPACRPASTNLPSLTGGEQCSKLIIPAHAGVRWYTERSPPFRIRTQHRTFRGFTHALPLRC